MFGESVRQPSRVSGAIHFVFETNHAGRGFRDARANHHFLVEEGRGGIAAVRFGDDEKDTLLRFHIAIQNPFAAAVLHSSDFHPDQVITVIDDSHLVGLRVADTQMVIDEAVHGPLILHETASTRGQSVTMTAKVHIRVLFFGAIRDVTGLREDLLTLPAGGNIASVFEHYASRFPKLRDLASSTVLALNQEFSSLQAPVAEGDEVAFLPPVSGGSGRFTHEIADEQTGNFYGLTRETIDSAALARRILRGEDGAIVNFEGVARNNTKGRGTRFLEYECYEAMAIKMMAQIGQEITQNSSIGRIAIAHRLGRLEIGEASVAVIVTSPHRKAAFDAALEGINRLKRLVPIWKKEYFVDGEVWVDGEWDDSVVRAR